MKRQAEEREVSYFSYKALFVYGPALSEMLRRVFVTLPYVLFSAETAILLNFASPRPAESAGALYTTTIEALD